MSGLPGQRASSAQIFDIELAGQSLKCRRRDGNDTQVIALDTIVCAIPQPERQEHPHKILFVQEDNAGDDSESSKRHVRLKSIEAAALPASISSDLLCTRLPRHLNGCQQDGSIELHIIISRLSGTGTAGNIFSDVLKPFLEAFDIHSYRLHETQSEKTVIDLARTEFLEKARQGKQQTIILLSGDGGLLDVIDAFYNASEETLAATPNIALIPTGTGNAMANSIGLLASPVSALRTLLRGEPRPLPVFAASFSSGARYVTDEGKSRAPIRHSEEATDSYPRIYGAVVASWGMHASLVADSDTAAYRKFGADRFKMAARELLHPSDGTETHKYRGVISLDRRPNDASESEQTEVMESTEHMYVLVAAVSQLEKNFTISPSTKPLQDQLYLVHFGPMPPDDAMQLMNLAYQRGQHVHDSRVTYEEIQGLKIEFLEEDERWRRVCIDGKIVALEHGGWMQVQREARRLLKVIACIY